jgi:hypothetical protein
MIFKLSIATNLSVKVVVFFLVLGAWGLPKWIGQHVNLRLRRGEVAWLVSMPGLSLI